MNENIKHIFLFRHGQTDWNVSGTLQGHADIPLNETGRTQAHELGKTLTDKRLDIIISSDLSRADETARIVASYTKNTVMSSPALREVHIGSLQGASRLDVLKRSDWTYWINPDPIYDHFGFPGGETKRQAQERITTWLEEFLATTDHTRIGMCSHAQIMRLLMRRYASAAPVRLENCALIELEYHVDSKKWNVV